MTARKAVRPLQRHLRARERTASLPLSYTTIGDTTMKDGAPFALAAIWESWHQPDTDAIIRTFCVITCPANAMIQPIHDRMPVIVAPIAYERWLSPVEPDPRDLLASFPPEPMTMWPVSTRVNSPQNNDPPILERLKD